MATTEPRFIVSPQGEREAVLIDIASYRRLLRKVEDLEDALALDRAEETSEKLITYQSVRNRLKRSGKL